MVHTQQALSLCTKLRHKVLITFVHPRVSYNWPDSMRVKLILHLLIVEGVFFSRDFPQCYDTSVGFPALKL